MLGMYQAKSSPGKRIISGAAGCRALTIASPYIKADALDRWLEDVPADAKLTCVTRWKPQDVALGASDLRCRDIVLERGGQFLIHPTLHAKYYRFDDRILVGSANLTMSGMGWGKHANLEILASPSPDFDWRAFEAGLLSRARPVSDIEYEQWLAIPPVGTQAAVGFPQANLDTDWRPVTREFVNVALCYFGRTGEIPSTDEARRGQVDLANLLPPSGLNLNQLRGFCSASLISSTYVSDVLRVQHMDSVDAARELGELHGLPISVALRQMETVHNWLRELAPELLPSPQDD